MRFGLCGHEELSVIKWCPYYRCDDCITSGDYVLCPYYWALNAVLYICVPRELSLMERCPYYRCDDCITSGDYVLCPYYWSLNAVLYVCVPRELSLMERCPYYRCGDYVHMTNMGIVCGLVYLWHPCGSKRTVRDREVSLL